MNIEAIRRRATARVARITFRATDARLGQPANLSGTAIRSILICRPNHRLGNLVLLTPLVVELARVFPGAKVDLVVAGDDGDELFGGFGNVRHIYGLSRRVVRHPLATLRVGWQIRRARYDLAIDPCEASQSSRLLLVLANARYAIGLAHGRPNADPPLRPTLHHAPRHMAQWPVYLVRHALAYGARAQGGDYPTPSIRLSVAERTQGREALTALLGGHDPSQADIVIGVFADASGAKRYPRDWWQRFIVAIRGCHPDCVLMEILPPDGRPRLAMGLPTFCARSPRRVAAMIANLTCFVSADCGVMHLASATGTPTIGLFSVTDVSKYRPYGRGDLAITTNGKGPEEIARFVGAHIERLAAGTFADPERPPVQANPKHPAAGTACAVAAAALSRVAPHP